MRLVFFVLFWACSLSLSAMDEAHRQAILKKIKPVGQVHVRASSKKETANQVLANKETPGQAIYEQHCSVCHRDGLAGAPKFQNENEWKPRLALKKDLEGLLASAVKGLNAMPAKGTCNECNEEDLKNAISYMLPHHG